MDSVTISRIVYLIYLLILVLNNSKCSQLNSSNNDLENSTDVNQILSTNLTNLNETDSSRKLPGSNYGNIPVLHEKNDLSNSQMFSKPQSVGSPISLLTPDRYEFYTFDDNGELVKRLMTLEEIQSIIAGGENDFTYANPNKYQNINPQVHDIVSNVQNVLKNQNQKNATNLLTNIDQKPNTIINQTSLVQEWEQLFPPILLPNDQQDIAMIPDIEILTAEEITSKYNELKSNNEHKNKNKLKKPSKKPIFDIQNENDFNKIKNVTATEDYMKLNKNKLENIKNSSNIISNTLASIVNITRTYIKNDSDLIELQNLATNFMNKEKIQLPPAITLDNKVPVKNVPNEANFLNKNQNTPKPLIGDKVNSKEKTKINIIGYSNVLPSEKIHDKITESKNISNELTTTISYETTTLEENESTICEKCNEKEEFLIVVPTLSPNDTLEDCPNCITTDSPLTTEAELKDTTTEFLESTNNETMKELESSTFDIENILSTTFFNDVEKYNSNLTQKIEQLISKAHQEHLESSTFSNLEGISLINKVMENMQKLDDFKLSAATIASTIATQTLSSNEINATNTPNDIILNKDFPTNSKNITSNDEIDLSMKEKLTTNKIEIRENLEMDGQIEKDESKNNTLSISNEILQAINTSKNSSMDQINDKLNKYQIQNKTNETNVDDKKNEEKLDDKMDLIDLLKETLPNEFSKKNDQSKNLNIAQNASETILETTTQTEIDSVTEISVVKETSSVSYFTSTNKTNSTKNKLNNININLTNLSNETLANKSSIEIFFNNSSDNKISENLIIKNTSESVEEATKKNEFTTSKINELEASTKYETTEIPIETTVSNMNLNDATVNNTNLNDTTSAKPLLRFEFQQNGDIINFTEIISPMDSSTEKDSKIKETIMEEINTNKTNNSVWKLVPTVEISTKKIIIKPNTNSTPEPDQMNTKTINEEAELKMNIKNSVNETKKPISDVKTPVGETKKPVGESKKPVSDTKKPTETKKPIPESQWLSNKNSMSQGLEASVNNLSEDLFEFSQLYNELSFKIWNMITSKGLSSARSVFVSPFSIISTLSMIFLGARGSTSDELNRLLKLDDMVTFNPHLVMRNISESVTKFVNEDVYTAVLVRELFSDKNYGPLLNFYKERVQYFYDGYVEEVGFKIIGDIVRRRTNLLVKKESTGKVVDFVKSNSIMLRSPLAAFSANIFQTDCSQASTSRRDGELYFMVSPAIRQRKLIPIPAVTYKTNILAGHDPLLDVTVIAIGNAEKITSTIFVMPGQQSFSSPNDIISHLEKQLIGSPYRSGVWSRILKTLNIRPGLEVQIPRFSHRSILNLTQTLEKMGLNELFNSYKADLRGLVEKKHQNLHLTDMLQVNMFTMCGESLHNEIHHMETYPATALRLTRAEEEELETLEMSEEDTYSNKIRNLRKINSQDESYILDYDLRDSKSSEPRDYQRAFHDPLFNPQHLTLPLALRPRQARIPSEKATSETFRIRLDRPFLYFVRHNPTGLVLHMGRFNPRLLP